MTLFCSKCNKEVTGPSALSGECPVDHDANSRRIWIEWKNTLDQQKKHEAQQHN